MTHMQPFSEIVIIIYRKLLSFLLIFGLTRKCLWILNVFTGHSKICCYTYIDYVNFCIKAVTIGIVENSDVIDVAKDITSLFVSSIIIKTLLDVDLGNRPVFVLYHNFLLHSRCFRVGVK